MIAAKRSEPAGVRKLTGVPDLQFDSHVICLEPFLGKLNSDGRRSVSIVIVNVPLQEVCLAHVAFTDYHD